MSEFTQNFMDRLKTIAREVLYFLSSKIFIRNFLGMLATLVGIIGLTFWWMKCYTHHGEFLQVPSFLNMSIEDAKVKAEQRNLTIVINDSTYMENVSPGTIIQQSPKPLSQVKENRTIYLTITNFKAEDKILPSLAGNDNYNYYERRLKQMKINLKVKSKQFNNKLEENTILFLYVNGQKMTMGDLKKGIKVPQGSTVEAVVTTRGGGRVNIPNLVCKKYSEAEFLVQGSQLSVGAVVRHGSVTNLENAYVWKQSPAYDVGRTLSVGTTIDIYVTRYPPEHCN